MGSGLRWSTRALVTAAVVAGLGLSGASGAIAASRTADAAIARAGTFAQADFPAGFAASASAEKSHVDNLRLAKGVDGCGPYVAVQKSLLALPQAKSLQFADGTRRISNEIDVFPSERAASAALVLYAKSSVVGCLENLFEKQLRLDPTSSGSGDDATVELDRQDIAGLGDDSVVYEGTIEATATDGSTTKVGIGVAAVRVGRTVDAVSYSTTGESLTDVLTPAIDASVARVRSALARAAS